MVSAGIVRPIYQLSLNEFTILNLFSVCERSPQKSLFTLPKFLNLYIIRHQREIVRRDPFCLLQETEKHRIYVVQIWCKWVAIQFCLGSPEQYQDKEQMSLKGKSKSMYLTHVVKSSLMWNHTVSKMFCWKLIKFLHLKWNLWWCWKFVAPWNVLLYKMITLESFCL